MKTKRLMMTCMLSLILGTASAGAPTPNVEVLVKGTTSWDGGTFQYPEGTPELTVVHIELPAGTTLPWHCHPVPLGGYLLRGRLTVTKPDGESTTLVAGEGLIEVSNQWHRGHADEAVELVVMYAGAEGEPLTIEAANQAAAEGACG